MSREVREVTVKKPYAKAEQDGHCEEKQRTSQEDGMERAREVAPSLDTPVRMKVQLMKLVKQAIPLSKLSIQIYKIAIPLCSFSYYGNTDYSMVH